MSDLSPDDDTSLKSTNRAEKTEKQAEQDEETSAPAAVAATAAAAYPSNKKRILIMTALYLAVFLVTLVRPHPFPR